MGFLDRIKKKFEKKKDAVIQADVRMISGCEDAQTSADVSNVASFSLPDPAGRAGGACTSALLNVCYHDHHRPDVEYTFVQVLNKMRKILEKKGFSQIPQLTSSREIDVNLPFHLIPEGTEGNKRALLIGINYVGQQGELSGCHNDVHNIKDYIMDVHGFEESDIVVLMDDDEHDPPTHDNIMDGYRKLVGESQEGDAVFVHYSGHGGKVRDDDRNEEDDGYDETLIPVDYKDSGMIRDDDVFDTLVHPMKKGVTLTCLMDCCHSGTVMDLPYVFKPDGDEEKEQKMEIDKNFDFGKLFGKVGDFFDLDDDDDED